MRRAVVYNLICERPVGEARPARRTSGDDHRHAAGGHQSAAGTVEPGRLAEHAERVDRNGDDAEAGPDGGAQAGVPSLPQPIFVESLKMLDGGCKGSTE